MASTLLTGLPMTHGICFFLLASTLFLGCTSSTAPPPDLNTVCGAPSSYEGAVVTFEGVVEVRRALRSCTAAACDNACCNACVYPLVLPCPEGSAVAQLVLEGEPDLSEPELDARDFSEVSPPPGDYATNVGCVGNECEVEACGPVEPSNAAAIEGVVVVRGPDEVVIDVTSIEAR